jgi:hypothetical protein
MSVWVQGAAEKRPLTVILSAAMDRLVHGAAKNPAPSVFRAMRDPSSPAAPQDDCSDEFFRSLSSLRRAHFDSVFLQLPVNGGFADAEHLCSS